MLLFTTGFEGSNGDLGSENGKWDAGVNSISGVSRSGAFAGGFNGSNQTFKNIPSQTGVVVGVAFRFASNGLPTAGNEDTLIVLAESTTHHVAVYVYADVSGNSYLRVKRGSTTLASDTTRRIQALDWTYVEVKATIDDSSGTYEVQVNGVQIASLTASGQDTRNGATGVITRVYFNSPVGVVALGDDIYIASLSGGGITDFISDSTKAFRIKSVTASSGNGSNTDFTPSTGSDHGALVDEATPNSDTDYNESGTLNAIDTYNYPALSLPGGADVISVQVNTWARKADAGPRGFKTAIRSGGTNYTPNAEITPTTTYRYYPDIFETDPDTAAAWTEAGVDAAEFGAKVTT